MTKARKSDQELGSDFTCPNCGTYFYCRDDFPQEIDYTQGRIADTVMWDECPGCGREQAFKVSWQPQFEAISEDDAEKWMEKHQ